MKSDYKPPNKSEMGIFERILYESVQIFGLIGLILTISLAVVGVITSIIVLLGFALLVVVPGVVALISWAFYKTAKEQYPPEE